MNINFRAIRIPRTVQRILMLLAAAVLLRFLLPAASPGPAPEPVRRTEQVRVTDWKAVDQSVRDVFIKAGEKAEEHARAAVRDWTAELRHRAEEDFLPWYFSYWTQQALALKAAGFYIMDTPAAEGIFGKQPAAQVRIEAMIEQAFVSRVLQPATAQLKIEAITREAVTVYLERLNQDLRAVQAAYSIRDQEWDRYLNRLAGTVLAVEGNRQVPLVLKATTATAGAAAVKVAQTITARIRVMLMRRGSQEMFEQGMMYTGRTVARGFGGIILVAMAGWEIADHQMTVSRNLPVMRRLLNDYFDQLESLVLNDPQCGVLITLDEVRRSVSQSAQRTE